ncbi:MAG: metallopeptidase (SprT family) [Proteobacteria bacterium]|nr:metallopeptidase (SprT family) [Pseudomonadota bacterium]NOG60013.1 metallopeptidase (SprT family) [Pseudomonadota bacterium]
MLNIIPLESDQQTQIISATEDCLQQASVELRHSFGPVPVMFDLKGRAAGMYKVNKSRRVIRYNPYIFARYFSENISTTVPHEVAHYIVDVLYGIRKTQPHGEEWKSIMSLFNADASVTCNFDLSGLPGRTYRRFEYYCSCRTHELTRIRHNRILKGVRYHCRYCHEELASKNG